MVPERLPGCGRKKLRDAQGGYAWFLLAAIPTANLLFFISTIRGDRLLYLASVGPCLMAADATEALWARRKEVAIAVAGAGLIAFGIITIRRNRVWRDPATLAEATLRDAPANVHARCWYAEQLMLRGDYPAAIAQYRQALRVFSDIPVAQFQLAACLQKVGEHREAESRLRHLFIGDPGSTLLAESLIHLCSQRGDWRCVAGTGEQVLKHNPDAAQNATNWIALGVAWERANRPGRAEQARNRAAALRASK